MKRLLEDQVLPTLDKQRLVVNEAADNDDDKDNDDNDNDSSLSFFCAAATAIPHVACALTEPSPVPVGCWDGDFFV